MAEIRGEKISFSRRDIVPLHELPSAQVEDPIIIHCPPAVSRTARARKILSVFLILVVLAVISAIATIESGGIDSTLTARAEAALNNAIGPRYVASVGSTAIRFDSGFRLAIEARDVDVVEQASGEHLSQAGALRMAIDPIALLAGRVSISHIEAQKIRLETAQLPAGDPMAMSQVRVDAMPGMMEQAFQRLDEARGLIERTGTDSVSLAGIDIVLPAAPGQKALTLSVNRLDLRRSEQGEIDVNGTISLGGHSATLKVVAKTVDGVSTALSANLRGLQVASFLLQHDSDGTPREGLDSQLDLQLSATRARENTKPAISATLTQSPGRFFFDGIEQPFTGANINAAYDFAKNAIEIRPSQASFGPTILPFTGAVIDLSRLNAADKRPGFGLDLLVSGGTAVGATEGEQPAHFDLKASGRYLAADRELQFDDMGISSQLGRMAGALKIRFGNESPEISFGAQMPDMQVTGVKQLWPFWMARKPREWVQQNLFGGNLHNASIAVFIPAGRMKGPGYPLELGRNELQIGFDFSDARINLPGDVPPLRDAAGHFDLKGEAMQVGLTHAASYFPSGRQVSIDSGTFSVASTYAKPLMADLALKLSGNADAVTELANFKPINALKDTDFKPGDFSGTAKVDIKARIGLIKDQNPPKATWEAHGDLTDVALAPPVSGRKISNIDGTLDVDTQAARLNAKAQIDSIPAEIALVQPIDSASSVKKSQTIKATLSDDQRNKLFPGLSDIVDGTVSVQLDRVDEQHNDISLDLTKATLSVPWIGWTKGSGIAAKAQFEVADNGGQQVDIRNFDLDGEGFGAKGNFSISDGNLSSAEFTQAKLSPADDFNVSVKRIKGSYDISVGGASADLRPIITKLRASTSGSSGGGGSAKSSDSGSTTVHAKLDRVTGFNDESLSNVSILYQTKSGSISNIDLSAVTESGQAVVSDMSRGGTISLTSGDAGALIKFANIYDNMRGGLLNLKLKSKGDDWTGAVDIRSFALVNEARLKSLVSSPVGKDGESLSSAVKKNIDTNVAQFQRGYATLSYQDNALSIGDGVVRGDQIGATFQGMLRDAGGNMQMTGTFMPAYGLNRLFGELPLIGAILGNGNDRGLLGITFKLEGPFDKPKLSINPLSIIAPGVFRQIFQFQQ